MRAATLRQLRAFSLVARYHSFKQAAAELHLTPAAVSLQIRELEVAAGLSLFDRQAATLTLTQAGEVLLVDAHQALQAMQHADDVLAPLRRRSAAQIHVGMVSSAKYFLPRLMAQFREQHPEVMLEIIVGNRDHLVENLRRGEVDLAVMGAPPDEMASHAMPFAEQPLGIIAAPEHPLAQARAIPPPELAQHEFMLREPGSGTRAALERFIKDQNIELPLRRELTGNAAVKQAVMANLGLAFMSLHAAALELQGGLLVSLDIQGLPLLRRWYVVQARTSPLSRQAQALRSFVVGRGTCVSVLAHGVVAGTSAARQ
jgi:DNA-binding transcriptional LysR family regulator